MPEITMDKTSFLLDGKRFWVVSGAIHYFRVPSAYWRDVLEKAAQAGLNTVETYVAWNFHEAEPGKFDWSGDKDLGRFLDIAAETGLKAIVRPGPYICSEWDFGGLPSWLVETKDITTRDMHPAYLAACERYLDQVLPIIAKRQYTRGGPVIMVQDENEYFFTGRPGGKQHLEWIRDKMRAAGIDVAINCCNHFNEPIADTLETMNGFSNACELVETLHQKQPEKPAIITEFWPGWFTKWGGLLPDWKTPREVHSLAMGMLARQGMYSYYMFFGGTDFGMFQGPFDTTSYDYGSPLSETRQPNEHYYLTRLANLCARNLGPLIAEMQPAASPEVEGPFEAKSLAGDAGALHFLRLSYKDTRLPVRNAKITLKAAGLPLRPTFRFADAVIVPENLRLSDKVTVDYSDLTPLGLMQGVLVLVGDAGAPFRCSVNGVKTHGNVPPPGVLSPMILSLRGAEVWVMNHDGAGRLFETASGELMCGYDYVSPAGTGFMFARPGNSAGAARLVVRRSPDGKVTKSRAVSPKKTVSAARPDGWEHASALPKESDWRALRADGELAREGIYYGYGWYRMKEPVAAGEHSVFFPLASDRVTLHAGGKRIGVWGRGDGDTFLPIPVRLNVPERLLLLADNLGRENFGVPLEESKGIYGPVAVDARRLVPEIVSSKAIEKAPDAMLDDWHWKSSWPGDAKNAFEVVLRVPAAKGAVSLIAARPERPFIVFVNDRMVDWVFRHGHRRHLAYDLGAAGGATLKLLFPSVDNFDKLISKRPLEEAFLLIERSREVATSGLEIAPLAQPADWTRGSDRTDMPTFYRGRFEWQEGVEAVFRPGRFGKGYVVVNGFNIGKYWEIGPYPVYYVPGNILHAENEIVVFDEMGRGPDKATAIEPVEPCLAQS